MNHKPRRQLDTRQVKERLFKGRRKRPCAYCWRFITLAEATFDHIIPLSRGGYDKGRNGVIACLACNQAKGAMTGEEFKAHLKSRAQQESR